MTPLLWEIFATSLRPKAERPENMLRVLTRHGADLHSFEVSSVHEFCAAEAKQEHDAPIERVFLPSPATWLEWQLHDGDPGDRCGFLVAEEDEHFFREAYIFGTARHAQFGFQHYRIPGGIPKQGGFGSAANDFLSENPFLQKSLPVMIRIVLSLINNPGVVGLKVHPAHKGRIKRLSGLGVGKFPLHAWHELTIGGPTRDRGGQEVESQQADRMPLHFVRAHWKPSLGRFIPAHWRGNAAYGIKRTRYKVKG